VTPEAKAKIGTAIGMAIRAKLRAEAERRFNLPLCSLVLHETLMANGKLRCPICEVRLAVPKP
jgi:hypothetical protein